MTQKNRFVAVALGVLILSIPRLAAANYCHVDNQDFPNTATITASQLVIFGGNLCGHTIYGSGCTLNADIDGVSTTTATCLTLGRGVTIEGNPNGTHVAQVTCKSSRCYSAIRMNSTMGSGGSTVQNIEMSGCYTYGLTAIAGVVSKVQSSTFDLSYWDGSSTCDPTASAYGLYDIDTVDDVEVSHAAVGVYTYGQAVKNSAIHDNGSGIQIASTGNSVLTNVFVHDNTYTVSRASGSTGSATINDATFANASTCHSFDVSSNQCTESFVSFSGPATFFDDELK